MATRDLVQALDAVPEFRHRLCVDDRPKDTYLYPLYATYTNGLPDFGDVSRGMTSRSTFTRLPTALRIPSPTIS
jgi:hypothetical protein